MSATMIMLGLAALYALARGIVDIAQRRYAWGAAGLICAGLLLAAPVSSQAIKVELPQAPRG